MCIRDRTRAKHGEGKFVDHAHAQCTRASVPSSCTRAQHSRLRFLLLARARRARVPMSAAVGLPSSNHALRRT
eukprot:4257914-Alexandrium_andersonii.AAC.1